MRIALAVLAIAAAAVALSIASCSSTPPNVTLHSFQQAQKVDVVCIRVNDANGNALPKPVPVAENQCTPVPAGTNGALLPFHLYAVVTQTTPGALAVVDLTAGNVVDVDRSTPGVDFIAVGATPTDVAVSSDGRFTFVSSADPNKLALYAIDNAHLLGNSTGTDPGPLTLPDLLSCALPQPPQALSVVRSTGSDGGPSTGGYVVVALLRAVAGMPAVVATIDPASMIQGSLGACSILGTTVLSGNVAASAGPGPVWADGVPYAEAGASPPPSQCSSTNADAGVIGAAGDGAATDGGVVEAGLVDGGTTDGSNARSTSQLPHPTSIALRSDIPLLYVADDVIPVIHVVDLRDPTNPREVDPLLATSVTEPIRRVAVGEIAISPATHDYRLYLYAIDATQGSLMAYDITDPVASPHVPLQRPHPELNPFAPLDRLTFSAPVAAVAFVKHDWPLPSQADAVHQYTGLLCNPNRNAHPAAGAFIDRGAYYRPDQAPLIQSMVTHGGTVQTFPIRLRGVFGFATLSNGTVVTIDVDDWDAPCRRPEPMASGYTTGTLDLPEPAAAADDLDPFHAPFTSNSAIPQGAAVTLEAFFPVSAPHRQRSAFLLRSDSTTGVHIPNLVGAPQLFSANGAPVAMSGAGGATSPIILPAPLPLGFVDPTYLQTPGDLSVDAAVLFANGLAVASAPGASIPAAVFPGTSFVQGDASIARMPSPPGVRVSFDDPTAHQDQDWSVTYEGVLPTVSGIAANITSTLNPSDPGAYQTLTLSAPGARFCARGVEDWSIGKARASQVLGEIARAFPDPPASVVTDLNPAPIPPQWTSDYVQISDDLLASNDPYWGEISQVNDCWDDALADPPDLASGPSPHALERYNACVQTFGPVAESDTHLLRDLPILHARDDSLEVGRFGWFPTDANGNSAPEQTTNRVVVAADASNPPFLRLTRCCFHHQAAFKVRAGGQWVAVGTGVGFLHHVKTDAAGSCVLSCEPRDALMNARAFDIPWWSKEVPNSCAPVQPPKFDRDSPLAMRNPMFSFVMWAGCPASGAPTHDHTLSTRDLTWRFAMRGGFSPLTVQLTSQNAGTAVSPQSMRFIGSLGQLAVVDGEAQGLVLIDLNLVSVAHNYF